MIEKEQSTIESRLASNLDRAAIDAAAEPALEPDLPIVDPHHHLWDYPSHRYLLPELLADTSTGHRIEATVFIECAVFYRQGAAPGMEVVGEVEFANGVAAMVASGQYGATQACAGIVGTADLTRGAAVEEVLTAQIAAGGGRFKGIRHTAGWEDRTRSVHLSHSNPPRHLYRDHDGFRAGFGVLGRLGLSFDAWCYHPQLMDVVDLARSFPDQPIVMNHVGGPLGVECYAGERDTVLADWRKGMQALAACPNVTLKLGGLGMRICGFGFEHGDKAPSSDELAAAWRPFIEPAIEMFGPERCMFESNFPVDRISTGYANLWNAFKKITAGASEAEKQALYAGTARRFYRL
ncbi:MAG: amidohydrolase family protein [Pseudomonadota bacterium]